MDAKNKPIWYDARCVSQKKFQQGPFRCTKLYAPVACSEAIRLKMSLSVAKAMEVQKLDFKGAFLHASLPKLENIWIWRPSISDGAFCSRKTAKMHKSLYRLKEVSEFWYEHFQRMFCKIESNPSTCSDCRFTSSEYYSTVYIIVYVDDHSLFGRSADVS